MPVLMTALPGAAHYGGIRSAGGGPVSGGPTRVAQSFVNPAMASDFPVV
ncbi:MAG TPA: hypothetical protein VHD63_08840 [Ktedonobacteraceae bacterium]|nr:hypothetical protein [Ktedonobacteraceae bacterium]